MATGSTSSKRNQSGRTAFSSGSQEADPRAAVPTIRPLAQLSSVLDTLSPALARAAKYALENPEKLVRYSLREWSEYARVGEASIVRLCHLAGTNGFSDFRIAAAQELALRDAADATRPNVAAGHLDHLADGLARSIMETLTALDRATLEYVSKRLVAATRIDIFGSGVSGIVAELFSYRLLRAGLNAHTIRDPVLAHEVAHGLGDHAAALAISESGVTVGTVEFLRSARAAGAFTIAVTCNSASPLAGQADAVLIVAKLSLPAYGSTIATVPRTVLVAEAIAHSASLSRVTDSRPRSSDAPYAVTKVK